MKEIEELKSALALESVLKKAQENHQWDEETAQEALDWYVKHWYLF